MKATIKNVDYIKELDDLKTKMEKAEKFAEKVPLFKDKILERKLTGEEAYTHMTDNYKKMHFAWGLNRAHYISGTNRYITNLNKEHNGFFWSVYINTLTMYNEHEGFGLDDIPDKVNVWFYDKLNRIFYVEDDCIEDFLEALYAWYLKAIEQARPYRDNRKRIKLEKEMAEIQSKLDIINKVDNK